MDEFGKQLESEEKKLKGIKNTTDYSEKIYYEKFTDELSEFKNGGQIPKSAGHDLRLLLEYQQKKRESLGDEITETYSVLPVSEITGISFSNEKYTHKKLFRNVKLNFQVKNRFEKIFLKNENIRFYENITFANPGKINDDDKFCCPSCGKAFELKKLEQDCPECQEASFITDLFPKVTNCYSTRSTGLTLKNIGKTLLICGLLGFAAGIPAGAVKLILNMPVRLNKDIIFDTISQVFYTPIEGLAVGIVISVMLVIGQLIFNNARNSPALNKINETKKIIKMFMAKYDKNFSYEHFENTVIFLTQLMIYCDDRENLPVCKLEKRIRRFDIIESVYNGVIELKSIRTDDDICTIELEIYMSDIHDGGNKIFCKDDVFFMKLQKNISKDTDVDFEIKKVTCSECGEIFDGWSYRFCPNCRKEYKLEDDDWIVRDFRLK